MVLVGIIWTWKRAAVTRRGGREEGFLCTLLRELQSLPRSVFAIGRVVTYQGWTLRGVPLHTRSNGQRCHKWFNAHIIGKHLYPVRHMIVQWYSDTHKPRNIDAIGFRRCKLMDEAP